MSPPPPLNNYIIFVRKLSFFLVQLLMLPLISLTLIHLPPLILFFSHLTLMLLLVVFLLLSLLQTISLFFSPFPLILLTVLPPPLLARSGYTISLTLSVPFECALELFLRIMTSTVHSKLVYLPTKSYLPWINRSFLNHVKIRNSIFSSAKRSGSPSF